MRMESSFFLRSVDRAMNPQPRLPHAEVDDDNSRRPKSCWVSSNPRSSQRAVAIDGRVDNEIDHLVRGHSILFFASLRLRVSALNSRVHLRRHSGSSAGFAPGGDQIGFC